MKHREERRLSKHISYCCDNFTKWIFRKNESFGISRWTQKLDGFCISTVCSVGSVLRNPSEIISSSPFYHSYTHYRGRIHFYFRASFLERTYLLALEWTPLWYTILRLVALSLYAVVCLALLMTIRDSNHLLPDGA